MANPLPESKVLKPRNPAITDENDWEIYKVQDACVYSAQGKTNKLASLLHSDASNPVKIVGTLEPVGRARDKFCGYHTLYQCLQT